MRRRNHARDSRRVSTPLLEALQEIAWVKSSRFSWNESHFPEVFVRFRRLSFVDNNLRWQERPEVSLRKGHTYRIVVSDLEKHRPIWFGGQDRSEASMDQFYESLGKRQRIAFAWP